MSRKADPSRPLQAASFRDYHARAALRKEGEVIYYKRRLGDYAKKTGHLTTWEHGAYCLILDNYYDREVAPTTDEACRWARAKEPDAKRTVSDLLADFFTLVDGRWVQQRVEDEIAHALAICETNRRSGKLGGRPPRARKTARLANANRIESETKATPLIHQSINPSEDQKTGQRKKAALPDWLKPETWDDWYKFRSAQRGWTLKARELSLNTLAKLHDAGQDAQAVVNQSIERGWTGLFPVKGDPHANGTRSRPLSAVERVEQAIHLRRDQEAADTLVRIGTG